MKYKLGFKLCVMIDNGVHHPILTIKNYSLPYCQIAPFKKFHIQLRYKRTKF